jgi:hypothetical protein
MDVSTFSGATSAAQANSDSRGFPCRGRARQVKKKNPNPPAQAGHGPDYTPTPHHHGDTKTLRAENRGSSGLQSIPTEDRRTLQEAKCGHCRGQAQKSFDWSFRFPARFLLSLTGSAGFEGSFAFAPFPFSNAGKCRRTGEGH